MSKETKIVQVVVVDGDATQIATLMKALKTLKNKLPFDAEFLVTNDKIKFQDVKTMIKELYSLYKLGEEAGVTNEK